MQLFLDCDGVLANFDKGAEQVLGMPPLRFRDRYGQDRFWSRLTRTPDFYATLEVLPDARELFDGVRHLQPIILTGCPKGGWAEAQKVRWAAEHFPGTRIITCMARDKRNHGQRGDILIDDTPTHSALWEETCGVFIRHKTARQSLAELRRLHPELF